MKPTNAKLKKIQNSEDYTKDLKLIIADLKKQKNTKILDENSQLTLAYQNKSIDDLSLAVDVAKVILSQKKAEAKKAEAEAKKAKK